MFILITTTTGNEVWINSEYINVIRTDDLGSEATLIFMNGEDIPIRVTDTVDEVINQINVVRIKR